jgi:hypothetical protein
MSATNAKAAGAEKTGRPVVVLNALLRCTRDDDRASPVFERVRKVPGLWVLELGPGAGNSWNQWLSEVLPTLERNEALLRTLGADSVDFTLHVTVGLGDGLLPVTLSPAFSQVLAAGGITLEMYTD